MPEEARDRRFGIVTATLDRRAVSVLVGIGAPTSVNVGMWTTPTVIAHAARETRRGPESLS